jgi:hypothetical protein
LSHLSRLKIKRIRQARFCALKYRTDAPLRLNQLLLAAIVFSSYDVNANTFTWSQVRCFFGRSDFEVALRLRCAYCRTLLILSSSFQELAATIFSCIDVLGVWWFLSKAGGASQDVKLLSFGFGWALGNNLAQYGPGLWIDARSLQFSWDHIQGALHANVSSVRSSFPALSAHRLAPHDNPCLGIICIVRVPCLAAHNAQEGRGWFNATHLERRCSACPRA